MLEPYIIEELKRREAERRHQGGRPQLELPIPSPPPQERRPEPEERPPGGVVIIDI